MIKESRMSHLIKVFAISIFSIALAVNAQYKSEHGQDRYCNENIFKNKQNGIFIDIGANDGKRASNSWFFEKVLGWQGICFEPNPKVFERLVQERKCECINAAISDKEGVMEFRHVIGHCNLMSGLESKFDPRQIERIHRICPGQEIEILKVQCYLLNDFLEKHNYYYIDFLSLDTEGGELAILKTIDFDRYYIYTITVENNFAVKEFREFLESKGFQYLTRLHNDEVYINTHPYAK